MTRLLHPFPWLCALAVLSSLSCVSGRVGPAPIAMPVAGEPADAVLPDHTVVDICGGDDVAVSFITDTWPSIFRKFELEELCTAPCAMRIPNGSYAMTAGGSYLYEQFEIEASGGVQTWEVDGASLGMLLGGIVATEAGLLGITLIGMPQLGVYEIGEGFTDDVPDGVGYMIGALSVLALAGGIWMLFEWPPSADLVSSEYPDEPFY